MKRLTSPWSRRVNWKEWHKVSAPKLSNASAAIKWCEAYDSLYYFYIDRTGWYFDSKHDAIMFSLIMTSLKSTPVY